MMHPDPELQALHPSHFQALFEFERDNRDWGEQWVPPRPDTYFHWSSFQSHMRALLDEQSGGGARFYLLFQHDTLVGRFNLTEIQSGGADVGYRIGAHFQGRGLAKLGLAMLVKEAHKNECDRLLAEALVDNPASIRVLESAGFVRTDKQPVLIPFKGRDARLTEYRLSL